VPVVLYLSALGALTVGSFCGFAYKGIRELAVAAREKEEGAWQLASLLAERRKQYVILKLADGGEVKGFIIDIVDDSPIVFIDTRRPANDKDAIGLKPKGKFRGPADIEAVDLTEVEEVQAYDYGGEDDDDDEDYEDDGEWGD